MKRAITVTFFEIGITTLLYWCVLYIGTFGVSDI